MGIKNLHKLMEKFSPNVYETIPLNVFAFKKIAIDISLYMFKYKTIFGDKWLNAFINLVVCLRKNDIHCVFIYDTAAPPEKEKEREERRSSRQKLEDKAVELDRAIQLYKQTGEITGKLDEICYVQKHKLLSGGQKTLFDIKLAEETLKKLKSQVVSIKPEDFELTRELFDILNVPYFSAPMEAETLCAHLTKVGVVDGVLSEDTDVLAYGTPMFLTKINTAANTCVLLILDEILEELDMTYPQFLDVCIMCGNDYNKNIPKIGFVNSHRLIKEHNCIENIGLNTELDISILNHERTRELFTLSESIPKDFERVNFCGRPDYKRLQRFLFENNCFISIQEIYKAYEPREINFSE